MSSSTTFITPRRSDDRGHADHGWLNSYHTFSFAGYYDRTFQGYGPLRVINEDRVAGSRGFPLHPHANYEIFSYVLDGQLLHKDSMGHDEVIGRGGVQFTSAGKGIYHSEYNADKKIPVHFLQIWVKPNKSNTKPSYTTTIWTDEEKTNQLRRIISPDGTDKSIKITQDVSVYASILQKGKTLQYTIPEGRLGYLHLAQRVDGNLRLRGKGETVDLVEGDGAFLTSGQLEIEGLSEASEFVFFDLNDVPMPSAFEDDD